MRSLLLAFIVAFVVVLGLSVPAQADFDTGWAAYQRGDYAAALRELRPLAEQGDAKAQFSLGVMYEAGQGVVKDDAQAVQWYRKAAEQGDAKAQFFLGTMYELGLGVVNDDAEAIRWYRKSAAHGGEVGKIASAALARLGVSVKE